MFCEESELDSSLYRVDWVRQLISLFDDLEVEVHTAAWKAFDTFVKSVPKDELKPLVVPLRKTIEGTGAPGRTVPGFSLPKGVAPTVPIIIAGLTTGSNEQRENAAYAIGDLVEHGRICHQAVRRPIHWSAHPGCDPSDDLSAWSQDCDSVRARCDAGEDTESRQAVFPAVATDVCQVRE